MADILQESVKVTWLSPILKPSKIKSNSIEHSSRATTKDHSLDSIIRAVRYFSFPSKQREKVQKDYVLNTAF